MSVTIDVAELADEDYLFAPSPLAELGCALHLLVEPAHHPTRHSWITATTAALEPELLDRLIGADFLWRTSRADVLLPGRPGPTLAADLDAMDELDDESWVGAALITSSCGSVPLHRELKSPLVDPAARELARERAHARGARQLEFVDLVLADPARARSWVRRLLEGCAAAFFADAWNAVVADLRADAQVKRELFTRQGLGQALAAISPAVTLSESGQRVVVDKLQDDATSAAGSGITFMPSVFGHPHLLVVHAPGWRPVIQYPLAGGTDRAPNLARLQQRLHALDHPVRLRLARSLIRGARTTGELAEAWHLSAPEVSRHLAVLKDAGIVTTRRQGRYVHYEFDLATNARLGVDIIEALLR